MVAARDDQTFGGQRPRADPGEAQRGLRRDHASSRGLGRERGAPVSLFFRFPRFSTMAAGYVAVGALAAVTAAAFDRNPLTCAGWLGASGPASWLMSAGLGLALAGATITATPFLVRHSPWARSLHGALRPAISGASDGAIFFVAVSSAAGEELLFRGLLVPAIGVALSSLVFGALHQTRGRGRWGWMAWATLMGLLLGAVFAATGSLLGPLLAHAVINGHNLRFLRDHDPTRRPPLLGGLLRR
jgi:membrane protease YdiL (CAAX protease family)